MNASPTDRERRIDPFSTAIADGTQLIGRLVIAPMFLLTGIAAISDPQKFIASSSLPAPAVALGAAILTEMICGSLLVIGYRTRLAAGVLAGFTLMTAAMSHGNLTESTQFAMFWKNLAIAGGLMQIVAVGAGRWSVDFN
ncbi:DoxX family protein [Novosphingobium gossypii]|uniref:DoxX family protein n=1 Tax=Novosphingobium gossypii TaxID=1604774 RepID=UPI003D2119B1